MNFRLLIILLPFIISLLFFTSCKETTSEEKSDGTNIELKKKELELKEKELALKEKELNKTAMLKKKISQDEAVKYVEMWANFQSNKVMDSYVKLYDQNFEGIKRTKSGKTSFYNYGEWISDRSKIFNSTKNLYVSGYNISLIGFDEKNGVTKIQFTQYYSSNDYSDEGTKIMHLTKDNEGNIKILKEEMLYAREVIEEGC